MAKIVRFAVLLVSLVAGANLAAAEMLKAGEAFPTWQMVDQSGATLSSGDLAGKVYLLWFYPRAMTPGCTAEGQGLRDRYGDFQKAGVTVLGVSFDEPSANAAFVKQEGFPFRLLSDRNRELAAAVGAADSREQPAARRISYLIGKDGRVLKAYPAVSPGTHAQEVLADLAQLVPK